MTTLNTALSNAHDRRNIARERLAQAERIVKATASVLEHKQESLTDAVKEENDASIDDAPRLAQQRRDIEASVNAARRQHDAAKQSLIVAQAYVKAAEAAVSRLVDELLMAESTQLANQILALEQQLTDLRAQLRGSVPDGLHTPVNQLRAMPAIIERALVEKAPVDDLHVPVNELRGQRGAENIGKYRAKYESRRRELIAGESQVVQSAA